MENKINRIYTKKLVSIKEGNTLAEAEDLMNNYNIRHLPVVDSEDILVGILSKSDFIGLKYADSRMSGFTVRDLMSSPVKAVAPDAKVRDVAKLFVDKKISCALVIKNDEAVGIVTSEDLLRLLAEKDSSLVHEKLDLAAMADEGWISMTYM